MISLRFHFEIGDFVKSPRESIWSKRGDGPRQLLCDVRSAVQRRGRSTVTQAVVKILTFEHGEKAQKNQEQSWFWMFQTMPYLSISIFGQYMNDYF